MSDQKPPRDINAVIDQIKEKVPSEEEAFIKRLDWVKTDSNYRPPEDKGVSWEHLMRAMMEFIPQNNVTQKWECEVLSIFTTTPLEVIMTHFKVQDT